MVQLLSKIELHTRPHRLGPEYRMVMDYVKLLLDEFDDENSRLSIFIEPRIGASYPDLVAVYWNSRIACGWSDLRKQITSNDLRIVHYLWTTGEMPDNLFKDRFSDYDKSLVRLVDAGVFKKSSCGFEIDRASNFAVQRIVAIEGKINGWQEGLNQALLNTCFASESYLLLAKWPKCQQELKATALRLGIGLIEPEMPLEYSHVIPQTMPVPGSQASWMFNEWCWHYFSEGPVYDADY